MKKVLLVVPSLEQGGAQKFVMDLADGLDKTKYEVRVLSYYKRTNSVFDKFAEQKGINTVYLDKTPGLQFSFFKKVKALVKEYNPDIIHTNIDSILYLLRSYKRKQVKLHTVHSIAEKESSGLQRFVRFLAYKIFRVIPVGISDIVADSISKIHHIKRSNIPVVYNGVDCKRYDIPRISSDKIRLVTVGTIYSVKNFPFLVESFAELCKDFDNLDLTIVGDGAGREKLQAQIDSLGLSDKIHIAGCVYDVENYLARADVYVACSLFEGLPISMLEAMSAGLPIVSTNVGGVSEIVKDGVNGILVEPQNKEKYVQALKELVLNNSTRDVYSVKAKELSKKYDIKLMVDGYEHIYQK